MSVATDSSSRVVSGGSTTEWRVASSAAAAVESAMFEEDDDDMPEGNYNDDDNAYEFDALEVKPSTLEVDYDKNLTELYQAITDQNWKRAASISQSDPIQAAIWVVRHYQDDEDDDDNNENVAGTTSSRNGRTTLDDEEPEIMWRFLPLHSACARQPPVETIAALLKAYPDAAKCVDDQGMYALHYACGNQAEPAVIRLLLHTFPRAAAISDPRGMLPLHYAACWGPSTVSVIDALLKANAKAATTRDNDGNIPLDLAMDGDYPEKNLVAEALRKWIRNQKNSAYQNTTSTSSKSSSKGKQKHRSTAAVSAASSNESKKKELTQQLSAMRMMISHSASSHGSDYNDAIVIDTLEAKRKDKTRSSFEPVVAPLSEARNGKSRRTVSSSNISTTSLSSSVIAAVAAAAAAPTPRLSNNSTPPPPETRQAKQSIRSTTPTPKIRDPVVVMDSPARSIESTPSISVAGMSPVKFSSALSADDGSRRDRSVATTASKPANQSKEIVSLPNDPVDVSRSINQDYLVERLVDTYDVSLVESLQRKVQEQERELQATLEQLASVQTELSEKNATLEIVERELASTKDQLDSCQSECSGLRGTLGDMMEQHETVKRKAGNTSDRLGTLSISLESMMEQQSILTKTVKERNESYRVKFVQRQQLFEQLLAMDKEVEDSEGKLDTSLKKQTREMEAIAAVIKAALD
jgi:ankyrin repeat protein